MTPVGAKWYIYPALAAFLLSFAWALATYDLSFENAEQIEKSVSFYSNLLPGLGGVVLAFGAALMGACFGFVFVKTGSLYPAIVAHAFANLPDFVMALLPEMQSGVRIALAVAAAVVSAAILVFIYKKDEGSKLRQ